MLVSYVLFITRSEFMSTPVSIFVPWNIPVIEVRFILFLSKSGGYLIPLHYDAG